MDDDDEEDFWTLLELLEGSFKDNRAGSRAVAFMISCCQTLELPTDSSREALKVAQSYLEGTSTKETLIATRLAYWKSVHGQNCDFNDPIYSAHRAVICTLSDGERLFNTFETLHHFANFFCLAGGDESILYPRLRDAFCESKFSRITI